MINICNLCVIIINVYGNLRQMYAIAVVVACNRCCHPLVSSAEVLLCSGAVRLTIYRVAQKKRVDEYNLLYFNQNLSD